MGQVFTLAKLLEHLEPLRSQQTVCFTNGCFDLLHIGHVRYLKKAREFGFLIVGVNTDASVKSLKGPSRPLQNENDRAEILASLECVNAVVLFDELTPESLIYSVKPDILVKGGDWKPGQIVGADFVQSRGGKVYSLNFVDGKSTTKIIEKMNT